MYTEFIVIYIGLGILALLLIAAIILLVFVLKKTEARPPVSTAMPVYNPQSRVGQSAQMGIVFCRGCGVQYDGASRVCPRCGMPR